MLAPSSEPIADARAFETAVTAAVPSMRAFAISLCKDRVRADDLVQDAVLRALDNRGRFQPGTNLGAWLFTILRNNFRSEYRKRRREVEDPDMVHADAIAVGGEDDEESRQDFTKMVGLLACLPQDQRDAVVAVGYLGLSYEQSAVALKCAVGTVKSRVNRGRTVLAQMMQDVAEVQFDAASIVAAARAVPRGHRLHPIAAAYEELYGPLVPTTGGGRMISDMDAAWARLVEAGGADMDDFDGGFDAH